MEESSQMDCTTHATGTTDANLAQAWKAGDERGYESIVTRYAPLVYHRCRRALGAADADDATQAVFLVLARKRDQATASPVLAAWLLKVANHVVCNALRDRERRRRAERSLPPPPPTPDREPMDGFKDHLDASLAELPEAERDAITLHHLAGHSLAEVARLTGAGLSTVKDRIQRGLDRLRRSLATRGVALGATALLACLTAEGQAAVPGEVLAHLRDLAPAGDGAGATGGPTPRALRWSRPRMSPMTRIALGGAALLLVAGALTTTHWSAEAGRPARPAVPAAGAPPLGDTPPTLVPERARTWCLLRVNDGNRLAKRLRTLPEMAFIPAGGEAVLDEIATVREVALLHDEWGLGRREEQIRAYRSQLEEESLPPSERLARAQKKLTGVKVTVVMNPDRPGGTANLALGGEHMAGLAGKAPPILSALHGWADAIGPEAPFFARLGSNAATESAPAPDEWTLVPSPGGWELRGAVFGTTRLVREGSRLVLGAPAADSSLAARLDALRLPRHAEADLEFEVALDTGLSGAELRRLFGLQLTVTPDGLRLSAQSPEWDAEAAALALPAPTLDLQRLAAIPGNAFLATGVALSPQTTRTSPFWHSIIQPLLQIDKGGAGGNGGWITAIVGALAEADGSLVAWVEPGSPLPIITVELDLPRAVHDRLVAALAADRGVARPADGSTLSFTAGAMSLDFTRQDGRTVFTTNPAGTGAIERSGGFLRQPEIVRALAALPPGPRSVCALLRPAALTAFASPFLGMMDPQLKPKLADYRQRLEATRAYGFLTVGGGPAGTRIEAAGMMALIIGAALAGPAYEAIEKLRGVN
jgi:RNA polymerase sigma factor (sigma-70 family)